MRQIDRDPPQPAAPAPPAQASPPIPGSILAACVLAWLGALTSSLLLQRHAELRAFFCPSSAGCERILASKYAAFAGIPLPLLGVVFYLVVLGLLLLVCATRSKTARLLSLNGALWITVAGATFSVGLMYLQFAVLRAFCPLCTASALIVGGLALATTKAARFAATQDWAASRSIAITLALFAVFPAAILMISGLVPPDGSALRIDLSTARITGPMDARVKLVVFSDFECPFCRQLAPVLKRIREQFPREVMFAYRHFPLEGHARAYSSAVAAECAGEQGAFWEYHDKLFAEGGDLSDAKLLEIAVSLGLEQGRFIECLKSENPGKQVEASRQDAVKSGIEGVPAVFLNGRRVKGVVDHDDLVRQIKALLEADAGKILRQE